MAFAQEASNIGQGIGGFLTPIIGGTVKTTTTQTPLAKKDNTIIIVVVLVVVAVVGFLMFKPKAS